MEFITDPDLHLMVPPLILQPLVENAIKYGVDERGKRTIRIHVADEGTHYGFSVRDQGPGRFECLYPGNSHHGPADSRPPGCRWYFGR